MQRPDDGQPKPDAGAGTADLRRTALIDRHLELGARMAPFAGWLMPIQYTGIVQEHHAVRQAAGLFDLGHMGQVEVSGPDALPFLQHVTTNDVTLLAPGAAQYSLLPNEQGGVVDDIIVYRHPDADGYMVVVNAANRDKDVAWLQRQRRLLADLDVDVADVSDRTGMIAIQGPRAESIVQRLTEADLSTLGAFAWSAAEVAGVPAMIARTGYTGEDGFEFYADRLRIGAVWDHLLREGRDDGLVPVGLGARDTLRLEARMPLYGHELADDINPLEAGLGWAVKADKGAFVGAEPITTMRRDGAPRRTVGFKLVERSGSARPDFPVMVNNRTVGYVTSGAWSPTLGENIGLALVERDVAGVGKPLAVEIRGRQIAAEQVKLPFYKRAVVNQDAR